MINTSYYKPKYIPIGGAEAVACEIDRLQDMTVPVTMDRTKIEEIGRDGIIDWRVGTPSASPSLRQLEYGSIEFYRKLANIGSSEVTVEFTDFKTTYGDIAAYKTDDNGTFLGTVVYPAVRLSGFNITIGDPEALIERNFSLIGENEIVWENDNKYYIFKSFTATGGTNETFTVDDPAPVADPDNSGQYLYRVVHYTGGIASVLEHGTGWSYDGVDTLTINGTTTVGDVIKVWYSAGSYISGEEPFMQNDSDLGAIHADSCSIYLESSNYLYRLQSASIDVAFDRFDIKELGNYEIVTRGVRDTTVTVTLGRILEDYTIEEVLRGKAGESYGKLDLNKLGDNFNLIVKIYDDQDKTNFKIGYKALNLAPTGFDNTISLNDYVNRATTLTGESGFITSEESLL
jgi:hypothetical protein